MKIKTRTYATISRNVRRAMAHGKKNMKQVVPRESLPLSYTFNHNGDGVVNLFQYRNSAHDMLYCFFGRGVFRIGVSDYKSLYERNVPVNFFDVELPEGHTPLCVADSLLIRTHMVAVTYNKLNNLCIIISDDFGITWDVHMETDIPRKQWASKYLALSVNDTSAFLTYSGVKYLISLDHKKVYRVDDEMMFDGSDSTNLEIVELSTELFIVRHHTTNSYPNDVVRLSIFHKGSHLFDAFNYVGNSVMETGMHYSEGVLLVPCQTDGVLYSTMDGYVWHKTEVGSLYTKITNLPYRGRLYISRNVDYYGIYPKHKFSMTLMGKSFTSDTEYKDDTNVVYATNTGTDWEFLRIEK